MKKLIKILRAKNIISDNIYQDLFYLALALILLPLTLIALALWLVSWISDNFEPQPKIKYGGYNDEVSERIESLDPEFSSDPINIHYSQIQDESND